ncbi:unnamed protein product [Didymodactylos carnosus]|nr:unnamed protein product [Didymodactylos carnosus]CAF3811216.1 unnamed protein product [Didymodactylos carnosus]
MTALDSIMNNETRSFDCTTATTANNNNYNINGSQLNTPTTTVTIFGFRENDVESIQNYFSNIGQIDSISREDDTNDTNYLNITYKNLVSFQNALNLSGILLDGCIIGVVPFKET